MFKKMRILYVGILIIIISFIISSCSLANSLMNKDKDTNVYYGTVEADTINISPEIPGKINDIKVEEGSSVKKGDIIAVIDSSESKVKLQQAGITVENSQNELEKVEEGSRIEEINAQRALVNQAAAYVKQGEVAVKQALNTLNSAQTAYDYRKKIYTDTKELYDKGVSTKYDYDNAKNQFDISEAALESARNAVDSANAQLEGFKAQLAAAQQKLNLLVNGATDRTKNTAKFGIEQANKGLELAKIAVNKGSIISDVDGIIETVNFKKGEYVTPGSPIATLINTKNIWVKIYVPEKVLPNIKLNKEVTLKSDFLKGKTIKGKITYISPEAEFTPVNIVTKEDRTKLVFAVKVQILDNLENIKPGMLLDVNID